MAGGIRLGTGESFWSTRSGIFYWVIDELAQEVSDGLLAEELREISEYNLGTLDLSRPYKASQRDEITRLLSCLPDVAQAKLPESEGKASVVMQLRELAKLAEHARLEPSEDSLGEP